MDDRAIDRARLLPTSGIGVVAPWLVIAPPGNPVIRIDLRALDRIERRPENEADEEPSEPTDDPDHDRRCDVLLACGDLEVTLHVADGPEAAEDIVRQGSPLTREAAGSDAHGDLELLFVGSDVVCQRGEYIQVGTVAFRINEVREYALRGANIPLPGGALLQAAMALLVVAAVERGSSSVCAPPTGR